MTIVFTAATYTTEEYNALVKAHDGLVSVIRELNRDLDGTADALTNERAKVQTLRAVLTSCRAELRHTGHETEIDLALSATAPDAPPFVSIRRIDDAERDAILAAAEDHAADDAAEDQLRDRHARQCLAENEAAEMHEAGTKVGMMPLG